MPSFGRELETRASWERFPARTTIDSANSAALSFDDGPDPEGTPAVLDALDAAGARATFFLVGEQLLREPRLAREIAARGHEVALHGWAHERHTEIPDFAAREDPAKGLGAVEISAGVRPSLFRPPYGAFSQASYDSCPKLGLEPVYWSAWGLDWEDIGLERIAELVVADLEPGAIVLLHDSARYAPRASALATAAAIPLIAAAAAARGLALRAISE